MQLSSIDQKAIDNGYHEKDFAILIRKSSKVPRFMRYMEYIAYLNSWYILETKTVRTQEPIFEYLIITIEHNHFDDREWCDAVYHSLDTAMEISGIQ